MEARQKLQEAIDLACCASIDVAVVTQDLVPRTAFLQLQLFDSRRGQFFRVDLGTNVLAATGSETVRFTVPANSRIDRFDELRIVFHQPWRVY